MDALSAGDDEAKWTRFRRKAATLVSRTIDANFNKADHFWSFRNCRNFREENIFRLTKTYFPFLCSMNFTLAEL
jgi:hypothetical protein